MNATQYTLPIALLPTIISCVQKLLMPLRDSKQRQNDETFLVVNIQMPLPCLVSKRSFQLARLPSMSTWRQTSTCACALHYLRSCISDHHSFPTKGTTLQCEYNNPKIGPIMHLHGLREGLLRQRNDVMAIQGTIVPHQYCHDALGGVHG